jgi:hypothetical protein
MFIFLDEAGHWSYGANTYKKNLILDYAVATYGKPVVCIQDYLAPSLCTLEMSIVSCNSSV